MTRRPVRRIPSNSQILLEWMNGCRNKVYFNSLEDAQNKLPSIQEKHKKKFGIYQCPTCRKFHLTSKNPTLCN